MTRIATVEYLNARPLTSRLDRDRFDVVEGHPSDIARLLAAGEVDVALVPVAAALTDGDFRIVGDVCIGAEGSVHSVLLVAETPPERWTRVVLDGVSRTSRTLARLLLTQGPLADRVPDDLEIVDAGPMEGLAQAVGTVAGLVIGDAARVLPDRLTQRLDLAELWHDWVALPFVFAVWAGRPDLDPEVVSHLRAAGQAGLAARSADFDGDDLTYVTESIRYNLDDRALIGLRRYAALAKQAGLVGTEDVQFYGPGQKMRRREDLDALLGRAADGEVLTEADLVRLGTDSRTVDLTLAASLRRATRLGPLTAVAWSPALRVAVTDPVLTPDEVGERVAAGVEAQVAEVSLVGALHPGVGTAGWSRWIRAAAEASDARVRALSLRGLRYLCALDELEPLAVLEQLVDAGLHGFAEDAIIALDAPIRSHQAWLSGRVWLGLAEQVHRADFSFRAGLEVGAGESVAQRVAHLRALDALQARTGGFGAMRVTPLSEARALRPDGATAEDYLRTVALARLAVDHIDPHEAVWLPGAPGLSQSALHAGADRMGPVPLPQRDADQGSDFHNPRAAVGRKREEDPWAETVAAVVHHLKRSGFSSDRRGSAVDRVAPPLGSADRPHLSTR